MGYQTWHAAQRATGKIGEGSLTIFILLLRWCFSGIFFFFFKLCLQNTLWRDSREECWDTSSSVYNPFVLRSLRKRRCCWPFFTAAVLWAVHTMFSVGNPGSCPHSLLCTSQNPRWLLFSCCSGHQVNLVSRWDESSYANCNMIIFIKELEGMSL